MQTDSATTATTTANNSNAARDEEYLESDSESSSSSSQWDEPTAARVSKRRRHQALAANADDRKYHYNTRSKKKRTNNDRHRGSSKQRTAPRRSKRLQPSSSSTAAENRRRRSLPANNGDDDNNDENADNNAEDDDDNSESEALKSCEYCKSHIPADATRCRYCQATLEIVEQMDGEGFIVMKRRRADGEHGGHASESVSVRIVDDGLRRRLQRVLRHESALMQNDCELSLAQLFAVREELRADPQARERTFLAELVHFLDAETRHLADAFDEMRRHGLVSFTMLPHAFPVNTLVYGWHQGRLIGMRVGAVETVSTVLSACVVLRGEAVYSDGGRFLSLTHRIAVQQFDGLVRIDSLPVRHMTDDVMRRLKERGALFRRYALGAQFVEYRGMMMRRGASRAHSAGEQSGGGGDAGSRQDATGRVMIDGAAMRRMQANYPFTEASFYRDESDFTEHDVLLLDEVDEERVDNETNDDRQESGVAERNRASAEHLLLDDERLFCTWPLVCGFSFRLKKWGEFFIDAVSPVQWDNESFDKLVLPDDHRRLVSALVTQVADESVTMGVRRSAAGHKASSSAAAGKRQVVRQAPRQSDIVANKGRGCVVLLHGPPGTGKTTTAETVAEHLKLPLYIVSAGELGVTADQLQKRLRSILDLCAAWRSIVLVDEADAFLARRSSDDVSRNALVCVFLRMLEYHSGILFLTTNRIRDFDEAFFSRVHLALPYAPLDQAARLRIWRTMLAMTRMRYNERQINLDGLSALPLNGRQIRTVVRLATMLALHESNSSNNSASSNNNSLSSTSTAVSSCLLQASHFALPLHHLQQFDTAVEGGSSGVQQGPI